MCGSGEFLVRGTSYEFSLGYFGGRFEDMRISGFGPCDEEVDIESNQKNEQKLRKFLCCFTKEELVEGIISVLKTAEED